MAGVWWVGGRWWLVDGRWWVGGGWWMMGGSTVVVSGSHVMPLCCLGSGRRRFALARISICLGRNLVGLSIVVAGACFVSQVL